MNKEKLVELGAEIARAHDYAAAGHRVEAVHSFALARVISEKFADPQALANAITRETNSYAKERDTYRTMIAKRRASKDGLAILSDSLAMPRPDDKTGNDLGAARTYPWLLVDALPAKSVTSIAQRFFTTHDVVNQLAADPKLGANSDIIIHVGLNDCAKRMFTVAQRLSLSLLPEALNKSMVLFAQKYRIDILLHLPAQHYSTIWEFRTNLDHALMLLRERKARKIILATIILPPAKHWPGTPGVNLNFATYNLEIMAAAQRHGALLLDIDRYIWATFHESGLGPDGMHLADKGHRMFTEHATRLLKS